MAGVLSGQLIDQFHPNSPFNSSISTHGPMSFNPSMHGTPYAQRSFSFFGNDSYSNDSISEESARKIASLQVKLNQKLGPEYISQRPGPGGGPKLTYVEGWKIINLANEVFGFNGWSSSIVNLTVDFADFNEESRRYNVGVTAIIRVTLKDGVFHEDVGYGMLENSKSKGQALDKCKKEAVTDGLKRALRSFGNVMGNCLYDKSYASEIVKVKFQPTKLNKDDLHRRPEFEESKPNTSISSNSSNNAQPLAGPSKNYTTSTPTRAVQSNQPKPLTSLPPHIRSEVQALGSAQNTSHTTNTISNRGPPMLEKPAPPRQPSTDAVQQTRPAADEAAVGPKREIEEEDESFGFGSDDEALIALADLGPAIDVDMGRPIDHDEGLLQPSNDDDKSTAFTSARAAEAMPPRSNSARTRHELIAAALAAGESSGDGGGGGGGGTVTQDIQTTKSRTNSVPSTSSPLGMRPPPPPQPRSTTSLVQQNHQRYMNNRYHQQANQDQNLNPAQTSAVTEKAANGDQGNIIKRVALSSMGGFNFPAGVNPSSASANGSTSTTTVGVKRPAEAMMTSNSSSGYRSARPGMGLQQAPNALQASSIGRNILGALDITDGGDVKRPRF